MLGFFKKKKLEEIKEPKKKQLTQEELEEKEFEELKKKFNYNKELEIKRELKRELEKINLSEKHSCKYCRFAVEDKETERYYYHSVVECTIKDVELIKRHKFNYSIQKFREEYERFIKDNECEYFRVITKYRGYRIEDINNVE